MPIKTRQARGMNEAESVPAALRPVAWKLASRLDRLLCGLPSVRSIRSKGEKRVSCGEMVRMSGCCWLFCDTAQGIWYGVKFVSFSVIISTI